MTDTSQHRLYPCPERDPLIEITHRRSYVTLVVALPRIMEEDVWFRFKNGILSVEISKYGRVFKKQSRVNLDADRVRLKNSAVHNSVLEMVFEIV